jgi:hypothetical protein
MYILQRLTSTEEMSVKTDCRDKLMNSSFKSIGIKNDFESLI